MIIDDTINILKLHESDNMDKRKSSLRLFQASKKYGLDISKLRIGDLL